MKPTVNTSNKIIGRLERNRSYPLIHPKVWTTPRMEDNMFEALMKFGGYRVDYLNPQQVGTPSALGLYILGDLPVGQTYSRAAKHQLFTALCLIRDTGATNKLVAVYLDINSPIEPHRPAYQQMKRDMKAGLFRRLCLTTTCDLFGDQDVYADFWSFYRELEWCEILSTESGYLSSIDFGDLANCPMVSSY